MSGSHSASTSMFNKLYVFPTEGYHSNMTTLQYENTNFEQLSTATGHFHNQIS